MEQQRVAFDDQIFMAQTRGGVSKYIVELLQRLPKFGVTPILLSNQSSNQHLVEAGLAKKSETLNPLISKAKYLSWRQFGIPNSMPKAFPEFDLLHHTFTNGHYLNLETEFRLVTIHDMTPELFPEYFPFGNPHLAKKSFCSNSDGLIAISQSAATDLRKIYSDVQLPFTKVIHHGISEIFFEQIKENIVLPKKYILFVGVRSGYKDFSLALSVFNEFQKSHPGYKLLTVGGGVFSKKEKSAIAELDLGDSVIQLFPNDIEIVEIYKHADALLFPSHYEGFGFPTLEAMATGTPVVLARNSCMEEIGGEIGFYFETGNFEDCLSKLEAATEIGFKEEYSQSAIAHARKFTWDETARKTADFYREIIK